MQAELLWQTANAQLIAQMPEILKQWLLRPYILTQHLKACGAWQLKLIQPWQQTDDRYAWVRKIVHCLEGQSVVYAEVTVPEQTYQQFKKQFGDLNEKPLGETLLYYNAAVTRGPFEYILLPRESPLYRAAHAHLQETLLWARRSTFYWKGLSLSIVEVFVSHMPPFKKPAQQTRIKQYLRYRLLDYAHLIRLHRPIPILLMLWPTLWGLWVAAQGVPPWRDLLIFIAGVVVMRSAGDIFNDLADRQLDGFVERTRMRPLATGRISVKSALVFACLLCVIALGLVLLLNPLCLLLAVIGLALALLYPWMKRVTHFPQVVLGIAYNWGVVMAFAAIQNRLPWQAWALLGVALIWTVAYDTMYALCDAKEDVTLGLKSTAVLFGQGALFWIAGLQLLTVLGLLGFGWAQHYTGGYFVACLAAVPFFIYQLTLLPGRQIARCVQAFNNNHWVGLLVWVGLYLTYGRL